MVWMLIRLDILTFDILVGHIPLLITLVNSLGPDQVQNFVAPDLDILIELVLIMNVGHFGHGHFGLGRFGLDISAMDISATENAKGGRFSQSHKLWVGSVHA